MITSDSPKNGSSRAAFSLVEVVVAVGIFAIAVISVIGLLGPINQSVANVKDGDDASRVVSIIQAELQRIGVKQVNDYLGANTRLYANRDGSKIGIDDTNAPWDVDVPDLNGSGSTENFEIQAQKFFQIKLLVNPDLTFNAATDGFLALNIELRWPAYTGDGNKLTGDALDEQNILVVPVAVTR
jgi:uncharacterized protein (TIGR02598 family)